MKTFRIVTDSFSGYEAQVKYSFFPFVWFQMDAFKGVNSWHTIGEAIEFIKQKKAGTFVKLNTETSALANSDMEVKEMASFGIINRNNNVVWPEEEHEVLYRGILRPAY